MQPKTCPECGGELPEGRTCQSVFEEFLALEFVDPGYGAVHTLTVACYSIQHGLYSPAALTWIEQRLRDHLERGVPVEWIRRQAAGETGAGKRGWRVTRRAGDRPQAHIAWSLTIQNVAADYRDADSYRELVEAWARATLAEMQPLVQRI